MDIPQGLFDYISNKLIPIKELSSESQKKLFDSAEIKTYTTGSHVFQQGDVDDYAHFLVVGKLEMMAMDETTFTIEAGSKQSFFPLGQMQPRQYSAKAIGLVQTLRTCKSTLEFLLKSEKTDSLSLVDNNDDPESSYNWMTHLLESKIFSSIPPENIQKIFALFEEVNVRENESIIKQGEPGDFYYIIQAGKFDVTRHLEKQNKTFKLATLQEGDGFGEEALLGDAPRNASVTATTTGILMRITKDAFLNLIRDPVIKSVNYEQAKQLKKAGAIWIDVRFPKEYKQSAVKDSVNLPLDMIRVQMSKLSPKKSYVVYCDNGARSAIAAYLLLNNGFRVSYLDAGIGKHLPKQLKKIKTTPKKPLKKKVKAIKEVEQLEVLISDQDTSNSNNEASALAYTQDIVQSLMTQETDMDELSKALSGVLSSLFKQLEQALNEKAQAEIAKNIAEQKLIIMQNHNKLRSTIS